MTQGQIDSIDFDRIAFEEYMSNSFVNKMCHVTEQAIKFKFPHIQNLDVSMGDDGKVTIIFDEVDENPTQKEVIDFLEQMKNETRQR